MSLAETEIKKYESGNCEQDKVFYQETSFIGNLIIHHIYLQILGISDLNTNVFNPWI